MTRSAAALLILLMAGLPARGEPSSKTPLVWAADEEGGAPYIFKDPEDPSRRVGFEVDLAHLLEQELGRPIEFRQYAFSSLIAGLRRGDFDFAMNGVEVTPDRLKAVLFSRPYYVYTLQLAARAEERRFNSLEECHAAGGVVGTLEDTAAERLLDQMAVRKKVYDSQVEPYLDLELGRIDAVLMDLPIAAYEAEIYRAGIRSIAIGQWEAAASLGMSRGLTFRRIILPQAIRVILPPMTNDFVALFKDTSIVSIIAVVELTKQYQILTKSSLKYLEIGGLTALLYLVMSVPLGHLSRWLEKRWGKGT